MGLVLGGVVSALLGGGWAPTWDLGMFDEASAGFRSKLAWMFVGGLFIGFGTRMAGGCTSGHGIFGLSNLERPSLVATLSFMASGMVTTNVITAIFEPRLPSFGTIFGFILSRSGAADYDFIQAMFLLTNFQLYGIIGTAVVLTAPGLWLLKRRGRTAFGNRLVVESKPFTRGTTVGGLLFGIGWSMAGMCPGPIFVNIGEGKVYALAALAGAFAGTALFGAVYPRVQRLLTLPPLSVGTGEGSDPCIGGSEI
jgi:uncharacterized membrane protein YedE/YeeE